MNLSKFDPPSLSRVVLIDDILTTGASLRSGIQSLAEAGVNTIGIAVAVNRSGDEETFTFGDVKSQPLSLIRLALNKWDPGNCPLCPNPYINLHNPEEDFLSVVLSMPSTMAQMIVAGYRNVYVLQEDTEQLDSIEQWSLWLPILLAGLPLARVGEDSGLVHFIRRFVHRGEADASRKRVLTELFGHLLLIPQIKVEARSIGCSILVGDEKQLLRIFPASPLRVPKDIRSSRLGELIPYYDALRETDHVFVFDRDGQLCGIRRLARSTESAEVRGVQLLRQVTGELFDVIGFVVRRERRAVAVYRSGRMEGIAELSEKTGCWEFTTPTPIVEDIESLIPGITRTLETVLEIAREMVARGYGGLFIVGDVPDTLRRKPPRIKVEEQPLSLLGTITAAEIAKLDGAVLVSKSGNLVDASVIIVNTGEGVISPKVWWLARMGEAESKQLFERA